MDSPLKRLPVSGAVLLVEKVLVGHPAGLRMEAPGPALAGHEHQRFRVKRAYGPWRASGAWWDTSHWARAEWEVILQAENAPMPLHALLVQDLVAGIWQLEGMYD